MYSKKLLLPFVGVIQVAELGRVRALSLDGKNWAIHYALPEHAKHQTNKQTTKPKSQFTLVATFEEGQLKAKANHAYLDVDDAHSVIEDLLEAVTTARIPFAASDRYECWLLDETDGKPLALLRSAVDAEDMAFPLPHPEWLAMPAAQLKIQVPEPEPSENVYVPPINYRLQKLVEERAGNKPKVAWFERNDTATDNYPPCLIREDWENEEMQQLCDLYIQRLSTRLLMLHGLPRSVRRRLELAARDFVFEVDRFYHLYPEVIDESVLNIARVEARLRHTNTGKS
jgi:hypothetical protein